MFKATDLFWNAAVLLQIYMQKVYMVQCSNMFQVSQF